MRLLVLYQAADAETGHPGFYDGFERMVAEGTLTAHAAIPYLGVAEERGWNGLWYEAERVAREMEADAVFLQFFQAKMPDPTEAIKRILRLPNKPTIFISLGDPYGQWTNRLPRSFGVASALSEVTFLTGMGYIAGQLRRSGTKNLVLMPNGCCQVRFSNPKLDHIRVPEFDVVFVGSRMGARNPFGHFRQVGKMREEFIRVFTKRYRGRFGLFGKGWNGNPSWQGPIAYSRQLDACGASSVVLGGMPNAYNDYYMSDRVVIAMASGVPLVDYWVTGVDRIFKPDCDWWLGRDLDEMLNLCDKLLEMPRDETLRLAGETRTRVLAQHTTYHRCRETIAIVKSIRDARLSGRKAPQPKLSFLSESSTTTPVPEAIVGWEG